MSLLSRSMLLRTQGGRLEMVSLTVPNPSDWEIVIKVGACAVCRTDLHIVDGDLKHPSLPLVPGHEIVGRVVDCGEAVSALRSGDRVAVPWLASCCFECRFCKSGRENLCEHSDFTGYTKNGGYSEYVVADSRFSFKLSDEYASSPDEVLAPLLCAGLIGWRSFKHAAGGRLEAGGRKLGIYGFGAAGHLILQVANYFGWRSYVFTRDGDYSGQEFAMSLGAAWAGSSLQVPDSLLDAAIIFAPVGALVPFALRATDRGGIVICGGIHMSDIPQFPYDLLWGERTLASVANLTRADAVEFLNLAARLPLRAEITRYALSAANEALDDLRAGTLNGAAVLIPDGGIKT